MAKIIEDVSRTFSEYLLVPRLTKKKHNPSNVSLKTPISKFAKGEKPRLSLNTPFVSASMQAVSGSKMAISLSRRGALAFIFTSQSIENQCNMVSKVKRYKAGFVPSDSNLKPNATVEDAINLSRKTGHSTIAVTENGEKFGKFLGILTDKDYWEFEDDLIRPVSEFMTPVNEVVFGTIGISLHEANILLHKNKKECLPVLNKNGNLNSLVFKKDYVDHCNNPDELLDDKKRLVVAVAINTHDYKDRVPALIEAGADVLSIDASDGYSEYLKEAALWIREKYGNSVVLGGGNVVAADGFRFLVKEADVDFVKVGIGGGSICITREQKGIGRGQASALMDVVEERDKYYNETGIYIPVCSDGGLANDTQIIMALAMGSDFVMMGRYFAMTNESPTSKVSMNGRIYKSYWGEGSNRARNWQRYNNSASDGKLKFEEGVDSYVPLAGSVNEILDVTVAKLKSTLCNNGSLTLAEFTKNVLLTRISEQSFVESGTSNVVTLDKESINL